MYSIQPIYNSVRPFDDNVLQTSMYPMKPYYSNMIRDQNDGLQHGQQLKNDLPTLFPPIPADLDLDKDPDTRQALEDLLSRQMLLLCRLNELERRLIKDNDHTKHSSNHSKAKLITKPIEKTSEDLVIHFDLDRPPMTLLTVLSFLSKSSKETFMINYHKHSSLFNDHSLKQLEIKQKNLDRKLMDINFRFNSIIENCERINRPIIIVFIGKKFPKTTNDKVIEANYKSNQPTINDEYSIIKYLYSLLVNDDDEPKSNELLNLLLSQPFESMDDQFCIEKLGPTLIGLNDRKFLFNRAEPRLIDVIVWSMAKQQQQNRALSALLDVKWYKAIESMLFA